MQKNTTLAYLQSLLRATTPPWIVGSLDLNLNKVRLGQYT